MSTKQINSNNEEQLMDYLKKRTRTLETENKELRAEVVKLANVKDAPLVEYYLRLRRDLLEEIDKMKIESNVTVINQTSQNDKLENKILYLNSQLLDVTNREKTMTLATTKKTYEQTLQSERDLFSNSNQNVEYQSPQMTIVVSSKQPMQSSEKSKKEIQTIDTREKENCLTEEENEKIKTFINVDNNNPVNNENEIYIKEQEDKIILYETLLRESEFKIKDLNCIINEQKESFEDNQKKTEYEIESWKQKYNSIMTTNETLSNEYKKVYEDSNKNFKISAERNQYELEKKVMHLERLCQKRENDIELSLKIYNESINKKEKDVESMKSQFKTLTANYEKMHTSYEEYLLQLTKSLDNIKKLYFTREKEFINITNYYLNSMNDYSKPLNNLDTVKNQLELRFNAQMKEIEDLRTKVEEDENKIIVLENEHLDYKPKMRMKLTQSIKGYEESLATINKTHGELNTRLEKLVGFMTKIEEKIKLFNSILEDNKTLTEKNNTLECQLKMNDPNIQNNEILNLREQLFKAEKDNEVKAHTLKEYEDMFKQYDEAAATNKTVMYDEVVMKLRAEIARLNAQLFNLNKTKDGIEKFYQTELKNMMNKISKLNEHNDELENIIRKMENDFMGKKETILNLWMLEFKEFKENLINLQDIKALISKFSIQGDELTKHKEYICNEELYLMRQEIKVKDDSFDKLKQVHEKENKKNKDIVNRYTSSIDSKMKIFETLIANKQLELNSVKNERDKLKEIGENKLKLSEQELVVWKEQKEVLDKLTQDHLNYKGGEITLLKNQIISLQKEIAGIRKAFDCNLGNVMKSIDEQMFLIKDREAFTVKQLEGIEEQFAAYKDEKERLFKLIRKENEQLKQQNNLLKK